MKWLAVIALCGCNQIFGIREGKDRDAAPIAFFDAPIDAPFACPPIGTAPQFTPMLAQILIAKNCSSYTTSLDTGRALASCIDQVTSQETLYEGPAGGDLAPGVGFPDPALMIIEDATLMPEGDAAIVHTFTYSSSIFAERIYSRDVTGTWSETSTLPFGHANSDIVSNATRGPARHMFDNDQTPNGIADWAEDAQGTWTTAASFSVADFGASYLTTMRFLPDGLRMIFFGEIAGEVTTQFNYVDRTDLTASWSTPVHISGIPEGVDDAFMTEDCARVYFKALGSTFYAERI